MPLSPFQREVAGILAAQRSPASHVAGGAVINRADTSPRFSQDLDVFHDRAESVATCAEADAERLRVEGFSFEWTLRQPAFFRAVVSRGSDKLRLDWGYDSAFRFFPVKPDPEFGYCLHEVDLAINKVLAIAGRSEVRDFLDILYIEATSLRMGAVIWAACGKDQGYTPSLLLNQANRHSVFQESDLRAEHLARHIDLKDLKQQWLAASEHAASLISSLPAEELGCLYLDSGNLPVTPDPSSPEFPRLKRLFGRADIISPA
jgi:hypothetical protein